MEHGLYKSQLRSLQIELVKLQNHLIAKDKRVLVLFEGRDTSGKDGVIKRITEHLSPRETRVWAPGKPTDRDKASWYYQRYVSHLPAGGEMVLFNRSWYNRAGVEKVMGFCTPEELDAFYNTVNEFEDLLVRDGITLIKYYLDISKDSQTKRLDARRTDPLKQWKISPIDARALELWDGYSEARDDMLMRTHSAHAPWHVVDANSKRPARLSVIADILRRFEFKRDDSVIVECDPGAVTEFSAAALSNGLLAR